MVKIRHSSKARDIEEMDFIECLISFEDMVWHKSPKQKWKKQWLGARGTMTKVKQRVLALSKLNYNQATSHVMWGIKSLLNHMIKWLMDEYCSLDYMIENIQFYKLKEDMLTEIVVLQALKR